MSRLAKAPLVEVFFELRWGLKTKSEKGDPGLSYEDEDMRFFPGMFRKAAAERGFGVVESLSAPPLPFVPNTRFWRGANQWPAIQTGVGVLSVHQNNLDYDWEPFVQNVDLAMQMLDDGHPRGLAGLGAVGTELTFVDGLVFRPRQTPTDFIKDNLRIRFELPEALMASPSLGRELASSLSFSIRASEPQGVLVVEINTGAVNRQPALIVTTRVRSAKADCPDFSLEALLAWAEAAHTLQRHAFDSMIQPAYKGSFG